MDTRIGTYHYADYSAWPSMSQIPPHISAVLRDQSWTITIQHERCYRALAHTEYGPATMCYHLQAENQHGNSKGYIVHPDMVAHTMLHEIAHVYAEHMSQDAGAREQYNRANDWKGHGRYWRDTFSELLDAYGYMYEKIDRFGPYVVSYSETGGRIKKYLHQQPPKPAPTPRTRAHYHVWMFNHKTGVADREEQMFRTRQACNQWAHRNILPILGPAESHKVLECTWECR